MTILTCERLATCEFYNGRTPIDGNIVRMYKHRYCETDDHSCARYMVAVRLGPGAVPGDLCPNMIEKALAILEGKGFDGTSST